MSFSSSQNLAQKLQSHISDDILSSYSDLETVMAEKSIVPSSYSYGHALCETMQLSQLKSENGNLYTRLPLGPVNGGKSTCIQQNIIEYRIRIEPNQLAIQLYREGQAGRNGSFNPGVAVVAMDTRNAGVLENGDELNLDQNSTDPVEFVIGYPTAASPFSGIHLCNNGDQSFWNNDSYSELHSIICHQSIPEAIAKKSLSQMDIESLIQNGWVACGQKVSIPTSALSQGANRYLITTPIEFTCIFNLEHLLPQLGSCPILTPNMKNLYIRFVMNNFRKGLRVIWLNTMNPQTGGNVATQIVPLSKPSPIFLASAGNAVIGYRKFYARLVAPAALDGYGHPNQYPHDVIRASFQQFQTRQILFDLEQSPEIISMCAKNKFLHFPIQRLSSHKFQQQSQSIVSGMLQTSIPSGNINKFFFHFPVSPVFDDFLPIITGTNVNVQWRGTPIHPISDDSMISRYVSYKNSSTFIDPDVTCPNSNLSTALTFRNTDSTEATGAGHYGTQHLWTQSLFHNISRPIAFSNMFTYAFDVNQSDSFRRGFNSHLKGDYFSNSTLTISFEPLAALNVTASAAAGAMQDVTSFSCFPDWGKISSSTAVPIATTLCDGIWTFRFNDYGELMNCSITDEIPMA